MTGAIHSVDLMVFDLDGTLIDSQWDIANAVNLTLTDYGLETISQDVIARYIGTGVQPLVEATLRERGVSDLEEGRAKFQEHYASNLARHTIVYPGVFELLEHFAAKPKVVLTNKSTRYVPEVMDRMKLTPHFKAAFGRESFPTHKPDPGPLRGICDQFGVSPSRTVMIGDTETDLRTGKSAGTLTCSVLYGYGKEPSLRTQGPDVLAKSASEIAHHFQ